MRRIAQLLIVLAFLCLSPFADAAGEAQIVRISDLLRWDIPNPADGFKSAQNHRADTDGFPRESQKERLMAPFTYADFSAGGIDPQSGRDIQSSTSFRSSRYHRLSRTQLLLLDRSCEYAVAYYNNDLDLLYMSDWRRDDGTIGMEDIQGASFYRLALRSFGNDAPPPVLSPRGFFLALEEESFEIDELDAYVRDVPASDGIANAVKRAKDCAEISYVTKAVLPNQKGDIPENTLVRGLSYSSVRYESLYVPNCVSLETYYTAMLNPNSYVYSRVSDSPNSRTYYGAVCSSMVSYALDLPCVYTTHQLEYLPGMRKCASQEVKEIKTGYLLLHRDRHVAMCTGVYRDSTGSIRYIEVTEAITPSVVTRVFTPEQIQNKYLDKYFLCFSYDGIDSVRCSESPWSEIESAALADGRSLSPRRGDKANWRYGERIEIDILDRGDHTRVDLYEDQTLVSSSELPEDDLIVYDNLSPGNYKVCLSGDNASSEFAYFSVVYAAVRVEDLGNGYARLRFECSDNATPVWYAWCSTWGSSLHAAKKCCVISEEELARGYAITGYGSGMYSFKLEVQTIYGVYSSRLVTAEIT